MAAQHQRLTKRPADFAPDRSTKDKATIALISEPLIRIGVKPELFTEACFLRCGLTVKHFASLLRVFQGITDELKLDAIFSIGVVSKRFLSPRHVIGQDFYDFLAFLKSSEGQKKLRELQVLDKLVKKGGPDFTAEEMGLLTISDSQRADFTNAKNEALIPFEKEIAEAKRRLAEARKRRDDMIASLKLAYAPTKRRSLNQA